jgi:hypothetical protein
VQQISQFVASFSLQKPGFHLRGIFHVGLMVDKLALGGKLFFETLVYLLLIAISPMLCTHLSSGADVAGPFEAAVGRHSVSLHSYHLFPRIIYITSFNASKLL